MSKILKNISLIFIGFLLIFSIIILGVLWSFSSNIPDYKFLKNYKPPVSSKVYSGNGDLVADFSKEKRIFVPFDSIPALSGFSNNDIEYKYQWITNDNSASFLICEAFVDANDNITAWAFQTSPPPSSVFSLDTENFRIYPIPATNTLNIE